MLSACATLNANMSVQGLEQHDHILVALSKLGYNVRYGLRFGGNDVEVLRHILTVGDRGPHFRISILHLLHIFSIFAGTIVC